MSEPPDDPSGDPARYDSRQSYSTKPRIGYYRPMIPNIGPMEIAIVVIIALLVFGPRKLRWVRGQKPWKELNRDRSVA
jgi:hypothetical protein